MGVNKKHKKNNKKNNKKGSKKRERKEIAYRTKEERQAEIKEILNKLSEFELTPAYPPINHREWNINF